MLVGDLDAGGVPVGIACALNSEPGLGGVGSDELDDGADVGQGPTAPVDRDEREQAVLDAVPFRCAGRVVQDRDRKSGLGSELGQFSLPGPDAAGP